MYDYVMNNIVANIYLLIAIYYVPVVGCIVGYTLRTWQEIQTDKKAREGKDYYYPKLTYGDIVGRVIISFVPVVNALCFVFDICGDVVKLLSKPVISPKRAEEK